MKKEKEKEKIGTRQYLPSYLAPNFQNNLKAIPNLSLILNLSHYVGMDIRNGNGTGCPLPPHLIY